MIKVCYLVLVYNNVKDTLETLDCIKTQIRNDEIAISTVIVDNNSRDEFKIPVEKYANENNIRYIYRTVNDGYAGGNNFGWELLKNDYDYIFVINNDIIINDDFLTVKFVNIFEKNLSLGILGPRVLVGNNEDIIEPTINKIFYKYFYNYKFNITNDYMEKHAIIGCFMCIRSSVIKESLFDESFFMYAEELNLCLKVWNSKNKVAIINDKDCSIYHKGGANPFDSKQRWKFYLTTRNSILCSRNFPIYSRIVYIFLMFLSTVKLAFKKTYNSKIKKAAFNGFFSGLKFLMFKTNKDKILLDAKNNLF